MKITHIDQILPRIKGRSEFVVLDRGDYQVIDYVYLTDDSFDDPVRLECRGIKFRADGTLLARPFHKFFNIGEKQQGDEIDWAQPHIITEKLDGSMIHPVVMGDKVLLMTRKGHTDVARQAEKHFLNRENYFRFFCDAFMRHGMTPIFEFTAPDNRIVLRYDEPGLTLLGARKTISGEYVSFGQLAEFANDYSIPIVDFLSADIDDMGIDDFIKYSRELQDKEGFVIQFSDGHMLKIKSDEYVFKHRALSGFDSKRKILALVLDGFMDDVLPVLDDSDKEELLTFKRDLEGHMLFLSRLVEVTVSRARDMKMSRKDFALHIAPEITPGHIQPALWRHWDGHDANEAVREVVRKRGLEFIPTQWRGQ